MAEAWSKRRAATKRLVPPQLDRKLAQQDRNVNVERGDARMPRSRDLADLRPPRRQQGVTLVSDELREFVEGIDSNQGYVIYGRPGR